MGLWELHTPSDGLLVVIYSCDVTKIIKVKDTVTDCRKVDCNIH